MMVHFRKAVFYFLFIFMLFYSLESWLISQIKEKSLINPNSLSIRTVKEWISQNAIPLKTVEARHGFQDLQPLKKILKHVQVVGLGEASHGTREFFQFKHRLFEFLVKEMGYTVLAFEDPYNACVDINEFILYGKGDPVKAVARQGKGFICWNTEEVLAMVEWMHEYNQTVPERKKVKFIGIDMQWHDPTLKIVEEYLRKAVPGYSGKVKEVLDPLRAGIFNRKKRQESSPEEKSDIESRMIGLLGYMAFHKVDLIQKTSAYEFETMFHRLRMLIQMNDILSQPRNNPDNPLHTSSGLRDYYMAENVIHILQREGPQTRIAVWAHNSHVSLKECGWRYGGIETRHPSMGFYLKEYFGNAYYCPWPYHALHKRFPYNAIG